MYCLPKLKQERLMYLLRKDFSGMMRHSSPHVKAMAISMELLFKNSHDFGICSPCKRFLRMSMFKGRLFTNIGVKDHAPRLMSPYITQ